jgi:hypothetical protein
MLQATLTLTKAELNQAVSEWLERRGLHITDRFSVSVKVTPGDRPFDPEITEITATGVRVAPK